MGDTFSYALSVSFFYQFTDDKMMSNLLDNNGWNESLVSLLSQPGLRNLCMTVEKLDD